MNAKQFAQTDAARTVKMSFAGISYGFISFNSDSILVNGVDVAISATFSMDQGTYDKINIWNPTLYDLSMRGFDVVFFVDGKPVNSI